MCSSRDEPGPSLFGILPRQLEAVRPVHGHRIDSQPLQRLQERLPRPAVERDALVHLRGPRLVLQEEDVRERVPGAEHGHVLLVAAPRDLVPELVDLGDGLLEVAVVDLVGG